MLRAVDLSSDIGELAVFNNDRALLAFITTANICCGVHAGSPELTKRTIALAKEAGALIGAHPGMAGDFGRGIDPIDPQVAYEATKEQLLFFYEAAKAQDVTVNHVKAHGALYNQAELDQSLTDAIITAIIEVDPGVIVVGLAGGRVIATAAARGLRASGEFFSDRSYHASRSLLPRRDKGSVITDVDLVSKRCIRACNEGVVVTIEGGIIDVEFDTICIHGDSIGAVAFAHDLKVALNQEGITVRSVVNRGL